MINIIAILLALPLVLLHVDGLGRKDFETIVEEELLDLAGGMEWRGAERADRYCQDYSTEKNCLHMLLGVGLASDISPTLVHLDEHHLISCY